MSAQAERTEQPTPRRLQQAREKGDFVNSREFVAAAQFFAFLFALSFWGSQCFTALKQVMAMLVQMAFRSELTGQRLMQLLYYLAGETLPLAGGGILVVITAVITNFAITGGGFHAAKVGSGLSNFSPLGRLREIRKNAGPAVLQGILLLFGSGVALSWLVRKNIEMLLSLPFMPLPASASAAFRSIDDLLWKAAMIFAAFGAWELFRQKRLFIERLRMTKQEIREEAKESEGNPRMKSRIRRLQRDLSRRRMMSEVPRATVVLVNPTHYAVALRYDNDSMVCPVVVAKGKNYVALRIRKAAVESGVPLVENPPLAQALYKSVEVGQEIPPVLYRAIAEVLAHIYRLSHRAQQGKGMH